MKHPINKNNMKNDIILTIALIVSLIISETVMFMVDDNKAILFFILTFLLVKITYNGLIKLSRYYDKKKGIQS